MNFEAVSQCRDRLVVFERIGDGQAADPCDGSAQAHKLSAIELIGAPEVVDDFGDRLAGFGIALVVGELEVFDR